MVVKVFSVMAGHETYPLEFVLDTVAKLPLEQRNVTLLGGSVRLEEIVSPTEQKPYWLFDFIRLRYRQGPGRAHKSRKVEGFDMENGDGFAEETAMLYCPASKLLFTQYNHFGVKDKSAESYFGRFGTNHTAIGFTLLPFLDEGVEARLARTNQFSAFTVKLALGHIHREWMNQNGALGKVLELGTLAQGPEIEICISAGHTHSKLGTQVVREFISDVRRLIGLNPKTVKKARVVGRDADDNDSLNEVLDMITPVLKYSIAVEQNHKDLRLTRDSRFEGLEKVYADWLRRRET